METAQCLGVFMATCPADQLPALLAQPLADVQGSADWATRWTAGLVVAAALQHVAAGYVTAKLVDGQRWF